MLRGRHSSQDVVPEVLQQDPGNALIDGYLAAQVTGDILWDAPEAAAEVELDDSGTTLLAEPEGTRVMPSRSTLLAGAVHRNP
jgi:hypothetical protein